MPYKHVNVNRYKKLLRYFTGGDFRKISQPGFLEEWLEKVNLKEGKNSFTNLMIRL